MPINRKGDDSNILESLVFTMSQKFVLRQEADEKFLDKSEGYKLYINEPVTENIDIKNKKIINSGSPEDFGDLVNKKYIDDLIEDYILKDDIDSIVGSSIQSITKGTFGTSLVEKMCLYYNIALTHKPKFWLSSQFPNGLFPKLKKIKTFSLTDIMGNKVIESILPDSPETGTIYVENVFLEPGNSPGFILSNPGVSRITINFEFKTDYTFIFLARKIDRNDVGSIFTSVTSNRILGWRNNDKVFKVGRNENCQIGTNRDTNLHCYIVRCIGGIGVQGQWEFYDLDKHGVFNKIGGNRVTENFGMVVIGNSFHALDRSSDKGKGLFYELILFEESLSNKDLESIKKFIKLYYNFHEVKKSGPKVVDSSLLQNLN